MRRPGSSTPGRSCLYWFIVLGGAAMIITGYMLMFPFFGGLTVGDMQLAEIFHGVVGVLFVALIIAHIYLGTLGMEGAFESMGDGTVDLNWAKEHHPLWLEEEMRAGPAAARASRSWPRPPNRRAVFDADMQDARPRGRAFFVCCVSRSVIRLILRSVAERRVSKHGPPHASRRGLRPLLRMRPD